MRTTSSIYRRAAILLAALLSFSCGGDAGPSENPTDGGGADAGTEADQGETVPRYPGYCVAELEIDGNPGFDAERRAEYDENDRLVRDIYDSDLDGDDDRVTSYFYEEERLIRLEIDDFADGTTDEIRGFEYDAEGRQTRETWDVDADGSIEMDISFEHDGDGNRIRGEGQEDDDPDPELILEFEWDAGNLVRLRMDGLREDPDGTYDRIITYDYDAAGNLTTGQFDYDGDEATDAIVFYRYDCWK